jgi:HAD superfamily hydrolase (TIGR01509 family)
MSIRGVIFDLGSTLIHRTGLALERDKCAALAAYAVSALGCRDPDELASHLLTIRIENARQAEVDHVERLAIHAIAEAFAAFRLPTDEATLRRAEAVFFEPEVRASRLYPGAHHLLEELHRTRLRLGMISNATSHQLIEDIVTRHGIVRYFDPVVSSAGFGRTKPHPAIFTRVLAAWGLPSASVVMVGDTLRADILGAAALGMRSILVDIEPNPDNARAADAPVPTARVTALDEIIVLLREWNARS